MEIRPRALASLLLLVVAAACETPRPPDPLDSARLPELTLTELSHVGGRDERKAYMLSSVTTAAVLTPDTWALIDAGSKQVRIFGTDGMVRRVLGSEGKGPDQFTSPTGLWERADGNLVVWDGSLRRTSTFDTAGRLVATAALPTGDPMEVLSSDFVGAFPDGSWVLRVGTGPMSFQSNSVGPRRDTIRFRHISAEGKVLGQIAALPGPQYIVTHMGGMVGMQDLVFGRELVAAVSDDALLVGVTDSLFLRRFGPDGTALAPLSFHRPTRPATKEDIDAERARMVQRAEDFGKRLARAFPKNMAEQETKGLVEGAKTVQAEHTWPAFQDLKAGPGGDLWIRDVSSPDATTTRWIRFDAAFRPEGWIRLAEKDVLLGVGDGLVLVRTSDAMDVQTVVCYRVGGA